MKIPTPAGSSILILHATAGAGHKRAAEAISAALKATNQEHRVVDTLECTTSFFRRMYVKSYIDLVQKAPELWGYLYDRTNSKTPGGKRARARLAFDKLNSRSFRKLIDEVKPGLIVCTHFLPLELLSDLKARKKLNIPVHAVVTDIGLHTFWVYPQVERYHVATPGTARELVCKGVPSERISVTGIPVDPVFANRTPASEARAKLGLLEKPTILILSGGFGVGPTKQMLASFADCRDELSLIVVAGKNAALEKECRVVAENLPVPAKVFGFVNNIHELMDAADLVVTKPGGLTTMEVLAKGKPLALVAPIPGQEQRNAEFLLEEGAAVRLYDTADAAFYLRRWLADPVRMRRMATSAQAIAKPFAAREIASSLIETLAKTAR